MQSLLLDPRCLEDSVKSLAEVDRPCIAAVLVVPKKDFLSPPMLAHAPTHATPAIVGALERTAVGQPLSLLSFPPNISNS